MDELGKKEAFVYYDTPRPFLLPFFAYCIHMPHSLIHTLECGSNGDRNKHVTSAYQM
jgi:hypothetical protein